MLRTDLRHGEREPEVTIPPVARPAAVRAEPGTIVETERVQQARNAVGVVDGFVHDKDVPQTHGFDLLVRELLTDKTSQFGVRLQQLALVGLGENLLRDPVVVLEEHALENGDFGRHATRRLEVRRTEHLLGAVCDAETVAFQTLDPVLAGRAVAGDREVDDAIFIAPRTRRFGNREFVAEKTERHVVATELIDDGVELAGGESGGCEFCAHDVYHDVSPWANFPFRFPLIRGGTMACVVIARNGLLFKPLFAMTRSQVLSKNYAYYHTPKHHICQ